MLNEQHLAKPEYVVSTSEFDAVKARLLAMANRRKPEEKDPNRPTLRRKPGSGPIEEASTGKPKEKSDEEERPTLKRPQ